MLAPFLHARRVAQKVEMSPAKFVGGYWIYSFLGDAEPKRDRESRFFEIISYCRRGSLSRYIVSKRAGDHAVFHTPVPFDKAFRGSKSVIS